MDPITITLLAALGLGVGIIAQPVLKVIVGGLIIGIEAFLAMINSFLLWIINEVVLKGQNLILDSPAVLQAWGVMTMAANVLFFLALVAFAIMIITRSGGYNFKKAITGLITSVALANLSYQIVLVLIEVGDALKNTAHTMLGFTPSQIDIFVNDINLLFSPKVVGGYDVDLVKYIGLSLMMLAVYAISTYVFFRLAFVLVERAVRLIILTIFGPIMFALSLLPHKDLQGMAQTWWSDLIRWVLVLPLAYLLLGIASMLKPSDTNSIGQLIIDSFTSPAGSNAGLNSGASAGLFMYYIVVIALMLAAANTPAMLKVPLSAVTKFMGDLANKPFEAIKATAGKQMQLGLENFKGTRAGGIFRQMEVSSATLDAKLDSAKKARQATTREGVKNRLQPGDEKTLADYDTKETAYLNSQLPRFGVSSINDLSSAEKTALKLEFENQDPGRTSKRNQATLRDNTFLAEAIKAEMDKEPTGAEAEDNLKKAYEAFGTSPTLLNARKLKIAQGVMRRVRNITRDGTERDAIEDAHDRLIDGTYNGRTGKELLKQAGYHWSTTKYNDTPRPTRTQEESAGAGISGSGYSALADNQKELNNLKTSLRELASSIKTLSQEADAAANNLGTLSDQDTKDAAIKALKLVQENKVDADILLRSDKEDLRDNLTKLSTDDINTTNNLTQQQEKQIDEIASSDATQEAKQQQISQSLGSEGEIDEATSSRLASVLSHGIKPQDLRNAKAFVAGVTDPEAFRNIRDFIAKSQAVSDLKQQQANLEAKRTTVENTVTEQQSNITAQFSNQDQYTSAVNASFNVDATSTNTNLDNASALRDEIMSFLSTNANPTTTASQSLSQAGMGDETISNLYTLIQSFGIVRPDAGTPEDFGKHTTLTQVLNDLNGLVSAPRPTKE